MYLNKNHKLCGYIAVLTWFISGVGHATIWNQAAAKASFEAKANPGSLKIIGKTDADNNSKNISTQVSQERDNLKVQIRVELSSLDTGIGLRNDHLKEKYLETSKFPTAEFKFESQKNSDNQVSGVMKLHGISKEIKAALIRRMEGNKLKLELESTIELSDFSITIPEFMGIKVKDSVQIHWSYEGGMANAS